MNLRIRILFGVANLPKNSNFARSKKKMMRGFQGLYNIRSVKNLPIKEVLGVITALTSYSPICFNRFNASLRNSEASFGISEAGLRISEASFRISEVGLRISEAGLRNFRALLFNHS